MKVQRSCPLMLAMNRATSMCSMLRSRARLRCVADVTPLPAFGSATATCKSTQTSEVQGRINFSSRVPEGSDAGVTALCVNKIVVSGIVTCAEIGFDVRGLLVVQVLLRQESETALLPVRGVFHPSKEKAAKDALEQARLFVDKSVLVEGSVNMVSTEDADCAARYKLPVVLLPPEGFRTHISVH